MSEPKPSTLSVAEQLLNCPEVDGDRRLAQRLDSILEFTQLLLDDDENLTRVGNLSGVAKEKLQNRALEIFDMVEESSSSDTEDAAEEVKEDAAADNTEQGDANDP